MARPGTYPGDAFARRVFREHIHDSGRRPWDRGCRRPARQFRGLHRRRAADASRRISQGFDTLYQLSTSAAVPINPHLIFVAETQRVTLSIDPTTIPTSTGNAAPAEYAPCETPWRDAALAAGPVGVIEALKGIGLADNNLLGAAHQGQEPQSHQPGRRLIKRHPIWKCLTARSAT
jgi:hypothetical protein